MLAAERHERILAAVRANGTVRLTELAARLAVTPVTVRRDVTVLADKGLLERVHGGVTLPRRGMRAADGEPALARSAFGMLAAQTLIGMVTPSVDYYWPQVIQGAQAATVGAAGRLALRGSSYDPAEDRRQVTRLLERGVRTLLIAPTVDGKAGLDLLRWLGSLTIPVVLMERVPPPDLPALAMDAVVTAHSLGAGLAVRHLVTLGHRRVGLVTTKHSPTSRALRSGWAQAAASLELPAAPDETVRGYGSPGWAEEYDALIRNCLDAGVQALLVHADREAIGVVERAHDLGLTIPGDLAVVAYDDEVAAAADPPLTAVRTPRQRLGATAVELALARVADGPDRPVHRVQLWPVLMVRESCGAVQYLFPFRFVYDHLRSKLLTVDSDRVTLGRNVGGSVTVKGDRATALRRDAPSGGYPRDDRRSSRFRRAAAKLRRDRALLLLAVPGVVVLLLFQYVPLLGNIIAFEDYEPYLGFVHSQWVGLANFAVLANPQFLSALDNTLIITLLQVIFVFPVPIALALLMNSLLSERLKRLVQSILYLPHFLSWVVVVAIFQEMLGGSGLLNDWLRSHGHATINIIGNTGLFKEMITSQVIWKDTGWATILFLAALSQISASLYEAASVDGASRWQQLRHITLPGLRSITILLFILRLGNILSVGFEQIILQQGPVGLGASEVLDTYVYHNGILGGQWGESAAVGLVKGLVGVTLVLAANKIAHLFGEQGLYQS